jgi:FkbM family methyltransferase
LLIPPKILQNELGVNIRGVIHIGACMAEEFPMYDELNINDVVWIEANPEIAYKLIKKFQNLKSHKVFSFAATDISHKMVTLNVTNNLQSSSILKLKKHKEYYPKITVEKKVNVFTLTLDDLFDACNLKIEKYNFLNIDIQGAELLALKGARNILKKIDYVYTEVNKGELYEDCCMIDEIDKYLMSFGFERIRTCMTKDLWGDAIYEKKNN